jgi:hypothetical protein
VGEAITEIGAGEGTVARTVRKRAGTTPAEDPAEADGGDVVLGAEAAHTSHAEHATREGVLVLGSGSSGLVYFTDVDHRMTLEEIEETFPGLLPALRNHPGIGLVMVRSRAVYGTYTASGLLRTDGFGNAPDLLIASIYDPQTDEVHPFEDFVGSHGGIGGEQTTGFVLHPVALQTPQSPVVGAAAVHELLTGWLADVGQPAWVARRAALASAQAQVDLRGGEPAAALPQPGAVPGAVPPEPAAAPSSPATT